MLQIASSFLLVEPKHVSFDLETEATNLFTDKTIVENNKNFISEVLSEFKEFSDKLSKLNVAHFIVEADSSRKTSTAMFCNNWISTHQNGQVVVYPLLSKDHQIDRNENVLEVLESNDFQIKDVVDFTEAETEGIYLEGMSSIVLDRENRVAYASISKHTDEELFIEFCEDLEFTPIVFSSFDKENNPIIHTNLLLSIGKSYVLFASSLVKNKKERKLVLNQLKATKKEIIFISEEQVFQFLGNSIQVKNEKGELFILMSKTAYGSLTNEQKIKLEKQGKIISVKLDVIESLLGGSVRNMLLENFLQRK